MIDPIMGKSLDKLAQSIRDAEALLASIPGSRHEECVIDFTMLESKWEIYFSDDKRIMLFDVDQALEKPLNEWCVTFRIRACSYIPELLDAAAECNPLISKEAQDVAEAISLAVKEHSRGATA